MADVGRALSPRVRGLSVEAVGRRTEVRVLGPAPRWVLVDPRVRHAVAGMVVRGSHLCKTNLSQACQKAVSQAALTAQLKSEKHQKKGAQRWGQARAQSPPRPAVGGVAEEGQRQTAESHLEELLVSGEVEAWGSVLEGEAGSIPRKPPVCRGDLLPVFLN